MKKVFFAVVALCAVLFCGCEKEDNGGDKGSLVVDGVNLAGDWVTLDNGESEGITNCFYRFAPGAIYEYLATQEWYDKWIDERGFKFKDGYFYGCTMEDFEVPEDEGIWSLSVTNGQLFIYGLGASVKVINKDTVIISHFWCDTSTFYRVKGFK